MHTYCVCGSWKHKHTRLFGFHPHCSTLLIHQANIKAAHQKLFSLLSSLFLRDLAEGERKKAGKILVYLKTSIPLMALGGDLGHSKFGETILLPVTHFFLVCWKGFFVLWPWKNGLTLYITHRRTVTKWVLWMHMVRFEKSFVLVSILSYISSVTEEMLYSITGVSNQGS